ncbi:protein of unknown function [Pseudomonas sp. JV241A]|nr:protein of unknown function [Pseudomonas sp. JV241A]
MRQLTFFLTGGRQNGEPQGYRWVNLHQAEASKPDIPGEHADFSLSCAPPETPREGNHVGNFP